MTEPFSTADERQLAEWAFGRQGVVTDRELAEAALLELARRAEVAREAARVEAELAEATRRSADQSGDDETAPEHPPLTDDERRHRRRMLATGWAGVAAAALALVGGVAVLSQPDPDPLAIFERPATERDLEWAQLLSLDPETTFTAGPRVFHDVDGRVGIVARASTVPDGRSTSWDSYCLFFGRELTDGFSISSTCTFADEFEREGLLVIDDASFNGEGYDTAVWGPVGGPRIEPTVPIDDVAATDSLLRLLAYPLQGLEQAGDIRQIIHDPDRLLMGPRTLFGAPIVAGYELAVQVYVLEGVPEDAEPELCMLATHPDADAATACLPLRVARTSGIFAVMAIRDQNWIVSVDAGGVVRAQEAQVAIPD